MSAKSDKVFSKCLKQFDELAKSFNQHILDIGKVIVRMMAIDREMTTAELTKHRSFPISTVIRLERVGLGEVLPGVFACGTLAGQMAERLSPINQKLLLEDGCLVVTGGPAANPTTATLRLSELTDYNCRILINEKTGTLRTLSEQLKARQVKLVARNKPDFEVRGRQVTFNRRTWEISELKKLLENLTTSALRKGQARDRASAIG